jgi:hypothetical protein
MYEDLKAAMERAAMSARYCATLTALIVIRGTILGEGSDSEKLSKIDKIAAECLEVISDKNKT